jgi:hypothetical protein
MVRLRAYTVVEASRVLGMTSAEVHKAIEHGMLCAFTVDKATQVPAKEVERVQANVARASVTKSQVNVTLPKPGGGDRK